MENKKLGMEPAFPNRPILNSNTGEMNWDHMYSDSSMGISKRLYIATKAMQSLIINHDHVFSNNNGIGLSKTSFKIADAMLKQENIHGNYWEITDSTGTIHSGTAEEMDSAWDVMTCNSLDKYLNKMKELEPELISIPENKESCIQTYYKWQYEFSGDIKLIEVHKIY